MTHTPGPWTTEETPLSSRSTGRWHVFDGFGTTAVVFGYDDEAAANARLIAAAPELLEALKDVLAKRGHPGDRDDNARAAIAKAEK